MGGASRRMGRDKALLVHDGVPLAQRGIDALRDAGATRVAVVGARDEHRDLPAEPVPDAEPGTGPVGGLVTAFAWAPSFPLVTLPCDLPRVSGADVVALLEALGREHDVVVATVDGASTHLAAAWQRRGAERAVEAHRRGAVSVRDVLAELVVATWPGGRGWLDADTLDDLR